MASLLASALLGRLPPELAAVVSAAAVLGYSVARTVVKRTETKLDDRVLDLIVEALARRGKHDGD